MVSELYLPGRWIARPGCSCRALRSRDRSACAWDLLSPIRLTRSDDSAAASVCSTPRAAVAVTVGLDDLPRHIGDLVVRVTSATASAAYIISDTAGCTTDQDIS